MDRKNFIGSSDIAAVLGLSPYKTPLQLWAEKTGKIEPADLSDNEAVEWGKRLEKVVAAKFSDKHNVKIMAYKKRFVHKEYPFLTCELDSIITGTDEMIEVKTCNAYAWKKWENPDEMPDHYVLQIQFALGISGRKKAWCACLCGGQRYVEKEVEFDPELFETMVQRAVEFKENYIDKDVAPMAMAGDSDTLKELYPDATDEFVEDNSMNDLVEDMQAIKRVIKDAENQKANIEAKIKQRIGDNKGLLTAGYKVSWTPSTYTGIDRNKMKEDGVYDKYKTSTPTRVMRITKRKGD